MPVNEELEVVNSLESLFPPFRELAEKFAEEVKPLRFYMKETYRSFERQFELFQKGRELQNGVWVVVNKSLVVTNARPGFSFHAYGLAFDSVPDGNTQKEGIQWTWEDYDLTKEGNQSIPWFEVANIGRNLGLEWAGDWKTFQEMPHFQKTFGFKISELYPLLTSKGIEAVWNLIYKKIKPTEDTFTVVSIPKPIPIPVVAAEDLDHISNVTEKERQETIGGLIIQVFKAIFSIFFKKEEK
jgi:peptidoglycan L-alanyl-D-glutamate endopeptidase CwlK